MLRLTLPKPPDGLSPLDYHISLSLQLSSEVLVTPNPLRCHTFTTMGLTRSLTLCWAFTLLVTCEVLRLTHYSVYEYRSSLEGFLA